MLKEALLYDRQEGERVACFLCGHRCKIAPGKFGLCNVRENREGTLYTHSYGLLIARNIDPIEKKPLYHFHPGSYSYSIASTGCNFRCEFCQNWEISQIDEARRLGIAGRMADPLSVVSEAAKSGCRGISYTYTEPTIFFEYALDIARSARELGLDNVFVTNGFMSGEMLDMFHPLLDAANIDLKSFRDDYYRKICRGRLDPVLRSIEKMRVLNIWVEVTTLVVPGLNDSSAELKDIASFLAGVDREIPWHISRFHPQYRMTDAVATPVDTLRRAYQIGVEAGLHYIYLGNVIGKENNTFCYKCGKLLIERAGLGVRKNKVENGKCPQCKTAVAGVGI